MSKPKSEEQRCAELAHALVNDIANTLIGGGLGSVCLLHIVEARKEVRQEMNETVRKIQDNEARWSTRVRKLEARLSSILVIANGGAVICDDCDEEMDP